MNFNKQQQEIIDNIFGAFLISAPVGTGKTTILTERVIKALESGIKPEEVLCLTFTNRASEEMMGRIKKRIDNKEVSDNILIKTFHGFCVYFVKAESKNIGINADFVIYDEDEQLDILKKILEEYPLLLDKNSFNYNREVSDLIEKIYKYRLSVFMKEIGCGVEVLELDEDLLNISAEYQAYLKDQNGVDFNELVILTLQALYFDQAIKNRWAEKYRFIQLDEFQDTHLSEYLVIKELAKKHKNISFIGDLDQTIYSWRGSDPFKIAQLFKNHFAPVKEFFLETNYRFSENILEAIKSFLSSMTNRQTKNLLCHSTTANFDEKCIDVFAGYNFDEEISWVVDNIKKIRQSDADGKIAVLARANYQIKETAKIFEAKGVDHITVDKYDFFRRQEVKDIFAYLKIIFNRYDLESAYRLVLRPHRNIGPTTLKEIREAGLKIGLRVSDFLTLGNYNFAEPFENLINKWDKGRIIALDTETTGTSTLKDDIIQIYAVEIIDGKLGQDFHYYIKTKKKVGDSGLVHGITDEFLEKEGRDSKEILEQLRKFIGSDIVVGHNVNFDLEMIRENGKRNNLKFEFKEFYDTLDLSRRLVESVNYKLNTLAKKFGLETATHSADDDVRATVGLLEVLIEKLKKTRSERVGLFIKFSKKFILLSNLINDWQKVVVQKSPAESLNYIWKNSGLEEYYHAETDCVKREASIKILIADFEKRTDVSKDNQTMMQELIRYATLVKNLDFLGMEKGKVPIVTVHQVKGLEFDYVFVVGMNEGKFPFYKSDLEEEKRLFYVALTRARKKIFLSYAQNDKYNKALSKSRFVDLIDERFRNNN
jgi:DNA helicase-2/ATP-dependent DNA helicase PcrA